MDICADSIPLQLSRGVIKYGHKHLCGRIQNLGTWPGVVQLVHEGNMVDIFLIFLDTTVLISIMIY